MRDRVYIGTQFITPITCSFTLTLTWNYLFSQIQDMIPILV